MVTVALRLPLDLTCQFITYIHTSYPSRKAGPFHLDSGSSPGEAQIGDSRHRRANAGTLPLHFPGSHTCESCLPTGMHVSFLCLSFPLCSLFLIGSIHLSPDSLPLLTRSRVPANKHVRCPHISHYKDRVNEHTWSCWIGTELLIRVRWVHPGLCAGRTGTSGFLGTVTEHT